MSSRSSARRFDKLSVHDPQLMYNACMTARQLLLPRLLIGAVLFFNLQCALAFLWHPALYTAGFGLPPGAAGRAMLRGLGLLFVMWNVPYAFALSHPLRRRAALIEALLMQAIGLLGESLILITGGFAGTLIAATLRRFILFDAAGLLLLALAFALVARARRAAA